jgi:adenine-specific DNA methylase
MGSKLTLLDGVLGERLIEESSTHSRFVDLFAGSGSVAHHIAKSVKTSCVAVDLQQFSCELAGAVIERTAAISSEQLYGAWHRRALALVDSLRGQHGAWQSTSAGVVAQMRSAAAKAPRQAFVVRDYGGHYFSIDQAWWLSAYRITLPRLQPQRRVALAALLRTASRCSASPGHTAQPFQPTVSLLPHIAAAWSVDVPTQVRRELEWLAPQHALKVGKAVKADSVEYASKGLMEGDLVFCDPPYSEAQYSRFYHVLEGIARGGWNTVAGAGRAPSIERRPRSEFSSRRSSVRAMSNLLAAAARNRSTVMLTYPEGDRSNGLAVSDIREVAEGLFSIKEERLPHRHSTLGGSASDDSIRKGRRDLHEVLFTLRPS